MNDLWQTEELLFAEIADQLKTLPEFARFASTTNNIWVDALGMLHLKITNVNNKWY